MSICPRSLALRGNNVYGTMDESDERSGHKERAGFPLLSIYRQVFLDFTAELNIRQSVRTVIGFGE